MDGLPTRAPGPACGRESWVHDGTDHTRHRAWSWTWHFKRDVGNCNNRMGKKHRLMSHRLDGHKRAI